jgi:hypothetical protein
LAAHFGCTVRELEERLGSDELAGWLAFERVYGLPDLYFATGQICATVAGSLGGNANATPGDFVPYFKRLEQVVEEVEFDDPIAAQRDAAESMSIIRAAIEARKVRS